MPTVIQARLISWCGSATGHGWKKRLAAGMPTWGQKWRRAASMVVSASSTNHSSETT